MVKKLDDRLLLNVDIALNTSFYEKRTCCNKHNLYFVFWPKNVSKLWSTAEIHEGSVY